MKRKKEKKNWLEWLITIVSAVLVAFTLGFLIYQLIFEERTPPDIVISLGEISPKDDAFALPITVTNKGTNTAENVVIEIVSGNGNAKETAQITFAYLAGKSTSSGWVTFTRKPDKTSLKKHVVGYAIP